MKHIIVTILTAILGCASLHAAEEHKHDNKKHDHEEKKVDVKIPENAETLWIEIEARRKTVSDLVAAKRAEGLHEAAESVKILAAAAPGKYSDLAPDKKKRLEGQVKNIARVLDDLHDEGEAGDWETAAKKLSQLDAALKIMKSQVAGAR
jgi:hypothetical protein